MFEVARPDATSPLASPLHVSWVLTSRCNLACEYCLEDSVPADADDVSGELRDLVAREVVENRVLKVSISGGEPLLVESLPRLIARLREGGVFVRLTTNGILMDGRLADRLAEARLSVAEVSLHPGRAREVMRALALLAAREVRTIVRVVVTRENRSGLAELVASLRATDVERVILQETAPLGRAAGEGSGCLLCLEEMRAVREEVERLRHSWDDERLHLASATLADHDAGHPVLCSLGAKVRKSCEVRPDGNVVPCAPAGVFGVGNMIAEKGLAACWRDIPRLYARFAEEEPGGECGACGHLESCRGGCRAVSRLLEMRGRREPCPHFRAASKAKGPERHSPAPSPIANQ